MAQVKITELQSATAITATAVFPIVQNSTDYQVTLTQAQNFMGIYRGSGTPTVTASNGSLFLREDGSAANCLYVRSASQWIPIGGTVTVQGGVLTLDMDARLSLAATLGSTKTAGMDARIYLQDSLLGQGALFFEGMSPTVLDRAHSASLNYTLIRTDNLRSFTENGFPVYNGTYNFTQMSPWLDKMQSSSTRLTMLLFYGADPWDGDFTGAAAWGKASLQFMRSAYPNMVQFAEIWNEGDGSWPIAPADLATLTAAMYSAIRTDSTLNNVKIAGGVTARIDSSDYWRSLIAHGLADNCDVFSIHDYDNADGILYHLPIWKEILGSASNKPVYISEYGSYDDDQIVKIPRKLSYYKYLGIHAATYFAIADFGYSGTLDTLGAVRIWNEWQSAIGSSAIFQSRDALDKITFSFLYNKNGTPVRHLFARKQTRVLINSTTTTLTQVPLYHTGTATVVLASGPNTLLADIDFDFNLSAQGTPFYYLNRAANGGDERQNTVVGEYWDDGIEFGAYMWRLGVQACGETRTSLRQYIVPSGVSRLMVEGNVYRYDGSVDVDAYIVRNSEFLYVHEPVAIADFLNPFYLVFDVSAGDKIEFQTKPHTSGFRNEVIWYQTSIYSTTHPLWFGITEDFRLDTEQGYPFLYMSRDNDNTNELRMILRTDTLDAWGRIDDYNCKIGAGGLMQPTLNEKAFIRWKAPTDVSVRVQGGVYRAAAGGDGTNIRILQNTLVKYSATPLLFGTGSGTATFDFTTVCEPGDNIDFEAASGGLDASADAVYWTGVTITPTATTLSRALIASFQMETPTS